METAERWWTKELGHLGPGARASVTIIDPLNKLASSLKRTGVGDLAIWGYHGTYMASSPQSD
ncbi:MAG TPA: hypothetical protein GXX30_04010 [Firmicutes bacterium]|nr:hypothetical protein [Candidatus Fermentithermobacillaceae bacterium]